MFGGGAGGMSGLNGEIIIKSSEYRPCVVNGKNALFHRWIDVDQGVIKFGASIPSDKMQLVRKTFDDTSVLPVGCDMATLRTTYAVVEFEDGTIKEVNPGDVKFLDTRRLMHGIDFNKGETE
jgi:hypothetical protein